MVLVTVAFSTTAVASAGTGLDPPATTTSRLVPAPHGLPYGPTCGPEGRESWMRTGVSEVNPAAGAVR